MRILIIISIVFAQQCFAQTLQIVNQNGEHIDCPVSFDLTLPNGTDTIGFGLSNVRTTIKTDQNYDFIKLHVNKCRCIKEYYNEYSVSQFIELDTLVLHEDCIKKEYTPLILFSSFDNWVSDSSEYLWFKEYLKEIDFDKSGKNLEIIVQSKYKSLFLKKHKVIKYKDQIAQLFGVPSERLTFIFSDDSYTTRDNDIFLSNQKVTKKFIREQNTKFMRDSADKFSLVGVVGIQR